MGWEIALHSQVFTQRAASCLIIPVHVHTGGGGHFMKLVITDNLSFTDYYHGNSQWQCFIANQNQECHCTCQWMSVNDKLSVMTSFMKCPPEVPPRKSPSRKSHVIKKIFAKLSVTSWHLRVYVAVTGSSLLLRGSIRLVFFSRENRL